MSLARGVYPRRGEKGQDDREMLLSRLLVECSHFRNYDFRVAVQDYLVHSGTLEAIVARCTQEGNVPFGGGGGTVPTTVHRTDCLAGVACSGSWTPSLEVRAENILDCAVSLQDGSDTLPFCNKLGVIFAAHPQRADGWQRKSVTVEEAELLGRTTWAEVFFSAESQQRLSEVQVSTHCGAYIAEGVPECIVAENVWLVRDEGCMGPGEWREPRDIGVVVGFVPKHAPALSGGGASEIHCTYTDSGDRARYRAQVDAAIQACCLLDCDGIVVGCAEGLCGSEVFGHPLLEVASVWREALASRAAQFRRVAFALGAPHASNLRVAVAKALIETGLCARHSTLALDGSASLCHASSEDQNHLQHRTRSLEKAQS